MENSIAKDVLRSKFEIMQKAVAPHKEVTIFNLNSILDSIKENILLTILSPSFEGFSDVFVEFCIGRINTKNAHSETYRLSPTLTINIFDFDDSLITFTDFVPVTDDELEFVMDIFLEKLSLVLQDGEIVI